MKWESDSMEGQPSNVFISKWLPQDDVLAHSNTKLFISHCGLGGVVEAKYHGVPIIGFPLFGDQPENAANVVNEGWGVQVDMTTMTEKSFKDSILEVLGNPK
jgi:glucuronosyltransferase